MIVVWSGKGYVVPVATFLSSLGMELLTEALFRDELYYQTHAWPLSIALACAALAAYTTRRTSTAGQEDVFRQPSLAPAAPPSKHTFFWIPVEHWAHVLMLGALLNLVVRRTAT